ncbi:MAG TPA: histidine kinase dimerization/phospho-acceptor domain-containing protein [Gaiellaceae bacterium]|nr:histidine kinase dimerization/phospho-acceptor domain-containing protein [Gaiellaceae bacterium]
MGLARGAALGDLAADVAHDVANPLFGVLGLVDLLLEDATAESEDAARLRLLRQTALEMKRTLQSLLELARATPSADGRSDAAAAARRAAAFVRHGVGKTIELDESYPDAPAVVACGEAELVQAVLHLLLAARRRDGAVRLRVEPDGTTFVAPAGARDLGVVAAARIAADHGGSLTAADDGFVLRLPA